MNYALYADNGTRWLTLDREHTIKDLIETFDVNALGI